MPIKHFVDANDFFPFKNMKTVGQLLGGIYATTSEKAMAPHPILLPGKSHGRSSLVGCSPWGH